MQHVSFIKILSSLNRETIVIWKYIVKRPDRPVITFCGLSGNSLTPSSILKSFCDYKNYIDFRFHWRFTFYTQRVRTETFLSSFKIIILISYNERLAAKSANYNFLWIRQRNAYFFIVVVLHTDDGTWLSDSWFFSRSLSLSFEREWERRRDYEITVNSEKFLHLDEIPITCYALDVTYDIRRVLPHLLTCSSAAKMSSLQQHHREYFRFYQFSPPS